MRRLSLLLLAIGSLACSGAAARAPGPEAPREEAPPHAVAVGERPPPIRVRSITGAPLDLATGKVTLLVFWATWSEPDKRELVELQKLYTHFGAGNLAIVALSIDDEAERLAEFARTYGLTFPIAWDAGHRFAATYRVATDPSTYVIDRKGVIRFIHTGYHDGEAETIASEVEALAR